MLALPLIDALSAICEATVANIDAIAFAVRKDSRVGPKLLRASGFRWQQPCVLEREPEPPRSAYWRQVVEMNEHQKCHFSKRVVWQGEAVP